MSFCKICSCGEKIVFDTPLSFPDECPSCGCGLARRPTYNEEDPIVQELLRGAEEGQDVPAQASPVLDTPASQGRRYVLRFASGVEIAIPSEGGIIGRTGIGAEQLADCPSVSRQHLRVTPHRNLGVVVVDMSSYGTLVDGKRLSKDVPERVKEGSVITLCDVELGLFARRGE